MAHGDDDNEDLNPVDPTQVKPGETVAWKDGTEVFSNLETNLNQYLTVYAKKRFALGTHKEIATTILSFIEKIHQARLDKDPLADAYVVQLLEYVATVNIKAKNSFLNAVLVAAQPELRQEREKLKTRFSEWQKAAAKVSGLQGTIAFQGDQILKLKSELAAKANLDQEVSELSEKLGQAEQAKSEAMQRFQSVKDKDVQREQAEKAREVEKQKEAAFQLEREKTYAGYKEAGNELRKEVAQLRTDKAGVENELSGARRVNDRLLAENGVLAKESKELKPKVDNLEQELKGVRILLEKQKQENFSLTDENQGLRKAVQKLDAAQEVGMAASARENKLAAELKKERKISEKWKKAFNGLLEVLNVLLKKLGREPIAVSVDNPESAVGELQKREKNIRVKQPAPFFSESPEQDKKFKQ